MNLAAPAIPDPADFSTRLLNVTEELRAIQKDLYGMSRSLPSKSRPLEKHEHLELVNSLLNLTLLADLKVVVDQLRQILRTYIDTVANQAANHPDYPLQVYRIQRATEALRLLHQGAEQLAQGELASPSSFIEHIDSVVEQRLRNPKPPAAPAPPDPA
jgi:hypothetical protein